MATGEINSKSPDKEKIKERQDIDRKIIFILTFYTNETGDNFFNLSDSVFTSSIDSTDDGENNTEDKPLIHDLKINITSEKDIKNKINTINNLIDCACIYYSSLTIRIYILTDNESPFSTYLFFRNNPLKFLLNAGIGIYKSIKYGASYIQMLFLCAIKTSFNGVKKAVDTTKNITTKAVDTTKTAATNLYEKIGNNNGYDSEPSSMDAKIAALLSHYVYFYLDWLEVYWNDYFENKNADQDTELIKNIVEANGFSFSTIKDGFPGTKSSKTKIKMRVISRINEILNITRRYSNDEKCKIIHNILVKCTRQNAPIDFYELYSMCGYFGDSNSYISEEKIEGLNEEAKLWHVCHPMEVARKHDIGLNIFDKINRKLKRIEIEQEKNEKESRLRKEVCKNFRLKERVTSEEYDFYYTTILHTGIDRISGYGGALFIRDCENDVKFIYATKGTDFNSFNDWIFVDVLQVFTGFSLQHVHTILNAQMIDYNLRNSINNNFKNAPLIFAGHSLGGGLASSNAIIAEGRHAVTFNAASLNFIGSLATRTVGGILGHNWKKIRDAISPMEIANRVHPIRIEGETIDVLQILARFLTAGTCERAYGRYPLIFGNTDKAIKWGHGMNNFLYAGILREIRIVDSTTKLVEESDNVICSTTDLTKIKFKNTDKGKIYFTKDNISKIVDIWGKARK